VVSTPFDEHWGIDARVLRREIDWLVSCGASGVTIAMVSELLRLTHAERRELAEHVMSAVDGRGAVVVSVGAESTDRAIELVDHALSIGATGIMANPPLSAQGLATDQLLAYFGALADASADTPLIVQDASGYVGTPLGFDAMATLLDRYGPAKIQFKPEAQPLGARLSTLLELTAGTARVFEGSGGSALVDNFQRGIVGTMPGPDLVWAIVPLWRALSSGDQEMAYRIQEPLVSVLSLVSGLDSYVAIEKHLLHRQGIFPDARQRQPVSFVLDHQTRRQIDRLVDRLSATIEELDRADMTRQWNAMSE